ncbi:hypothetical protein JOC95_000332 [Bacillus tianshenii]|uniref:GOLD domain-containing protein n=1 Tax=Sutcliffiella tianshenii TaxID=1463404 RepID=A0ABS2NV02_9BACI|nr:hypothetical protein [Bacillus tianshenii]MBM7618490.1 hypothetical protein [Bacillus tianshenii]
MKNKRTASKKRYAVAGILLIVAIVICTISVFTLIAATKADMRLTIPETKEFSFEEAGTYTIFHEFEGTQQNLNGVGVMVQEQSTNQTVELENYTGATYELNGRKGVSIFQFVIDEPGTYQISAENANLDTTTESILTIKQDFVKNILFVVLGILVGCFMGISAIVLFILTYVLRKRQNILIDN